MRRVWVYDREAGALVMKSERAPRRRVFGRAPAVIRDTMDPVQCQADGRYYDSKREYERAVKAAGCEIVADMPPESYVASREPDLCTPEDVKRALAEVSS